ncbi:MAG: 4-hydroxy-3-methylbut-2-enyl diphosphate reductase [Cytophagaceae bacterium]|nr:4-hydroxy-3-methylbut-2-enyl diphosphate reductase [Cytophagaceae bacterium]
MKSFDIPEIYKSNLITTIKQVRRANDKLKKDFSPTELDFGNIKILLSRHFGFCYGVENAVEIAYKTLAEHPQKRIFLLSEMIHNPEVNADLLSRGVKFLMDTRGNKLIDFDTLQKEDIVIVPAFGTTVELQKELSEKGINPYQYDTTCPFVEKVWNRAAQIGERGYSIIVHGKPEHEETRATFSHSKENTPTVVVKDMADAQKLAFYIRKEKTSEQFFEEFSGKYSVNFDPQKDLERIGVVNHTTMLATETQAIADYLKEQIIAYRNISELESQAYFANTRDTLCYATNDNQEATYGLMQTPADIAVVVGGYNSSNTTHLVELLVQKMPTYFIRNADCLNSKTSVSSFDIHKKSEILETTFLPEKSQITVSLTCGASCPDSIFEEVMVKLLSFFEISNEMISQKILELK